MRRSFKTVFAVSLMTFLFVFSFSASALQPEHAISTRPADSFYTMMRVDDLNGLLQYIFSPANVAMLTPFLPQDQVQALSLAASFASQIPAKTVIVAAGMTNAGPFAQCAVSMPDTARPKLDKVADGSATGIDLVTLLLGDAGMMFAAEFAPEVKNGAIGPYYDLMGQVMIAAREDLLLAATSLAELEASIGALDKKENRLAFKSKLDSPNYWRAHIDMHMAAALAKSAGGDAAANADQVLKFFKAPFEYEFGLSTHPESVLLSFAANILESMTDVEHLKKMKPAKGADMFMAGGGRLLLAISSPIAFRASDLKAHPETAKAWAEFAKALAAINLSEGDFEDLMNGSFSIALGSDATVMDMKIPGGYIAITGRKGAAAKTLAALMANEQFAALMVAMQADGWNSLYTLNQEAAPVPFAFGVANETLFAGFVDSGSLAKTPQLPSRASKLFGDSLFGVGFIDTASIWDRIRLEINNPMLAPHIPQDSKAVLDVLLGAELSVPFIKIWVPEIEKSFMEFSLADVPQENRILPRLIRIGQTMSK
jgi:hypothetical protein